MLFAMGRWLQAKNKTKKAGGKQQLPNIELVEEIYNLPNWRRTLYSHPICGRVFFGKFISEEKIVKASTAATEHAVDVVNNGGTGQEKIDAIRKARVINAFAQKALKLK